MEREAEMPRTALVSLRNYQELRAKVEALCGRIENEFREQLSCRKGCSDCCRHLSLFWVEAVALALALESLPDSQAERIRAAAGSATPDGPCPLLAEGACLLYAARPLICRTHGLPVLNEAQGRAVVDFCDLNFRGLGSLPARALINLDLLNTTLAGINHLFVSEIFHGHPPEKERLSIAEALLLDL